jgi:hypothetical protein
MHQYGLSPRVTSAFRDPSHQKAMQAAWDRGDRAGLRRRPATNSKHSNESWGRPAALAVDIVTSNDDMGARIARALAIGAGADFGGSEYDPGHYYAK